MLRHGGGVHTNVSQEVLASCRLSKGSVWMEAQLKWISESPGHVGTQL